MNPLITPSNSPSPSEPEVNQKTSNTSQVLLPRVLVQRMKEGLKELSQDTGADYSLVHFVSRVLEKHWTGDMEQLRKGLEKLNLSK